MFESSVKEKDHQTKEDVNMKKQRFESSVKEKDHQTTLLMARQARLFESSVKEKDHQTEGRQYQTEACLRAV